MSAAELQERAAATSRTVVQERQPFSALPEGWSVIGRCRFGTGVPGPSATGCYALAHPEVGVALIDIAPDATPNAEARLRRALTAAEFWPDFPGTLPVMHDRVDGTALRSLHWVLEQGFAALPALTVPGGAAWMEGVQRAMAADSAWELPGQPKAMQDAPPAPSDTGEAAAAPPRSRSALPPRRWGRLAALPLAFAGTFALGLVSGFLLLDEPTPAAPAPPVAAAPPQSPAAPAQTAAVAAPEVGPRATDAATAAPAASARPSAVADATPRPAPQATAPAASTVAAPTPRPAPEATAPAAIPTPSTVAAATPRPAPEAAAPAPSTMAAVTPRPAPETAVPAAATAAATAPAAVPAPPPPLAAASPPAALQPVVSATAEAPASPPAPVQPPGVAQQASAPAVGAAGLVPSSPLETPLSHSMRVEPALPAAPPRAPSPPVRVSAPQQASRSAPVIDRACSQALFRFQQGERLTAAEQNFLRTGCSTARR